jgi:hypothetical protein
MLTQSQEESMLGEGSHLLVKATAADNAGDFEAALGLYQRAIDLLVEGQMYAADDAEAAMAHHNVELYSHRLRELRKQFGKDTV